jgi:hypothetical protein
LRLAHDCGVGVLAAQTSEKDFDSAQQALLGAYPECTAGQKEWINSVIEASMQLIDAARADAGWNSHARTRWFGAANLVPNEGFERMRNIHNSVRCGGPSCQGRNGFTNGERPPKIYLCEEAFYLPWLSGHEFSQVETLVHEIAHAQDSPEGQIIDYPHDTCTEPVWSESRCYGYTNARRLADECPACARLTADNYAGFAFEAITRPALFAVIN